MMTAINPYVTSAADDRFFNLCPAAFKNERITRIVCNVLKQLTKIVLYPLVITIGISLVMGLSACFGALSTVALVALSILLGAFFMTMAVVAIRDKCKRRAILASDRLNDGALPLIEIVNRFVKMANRPAIGAIQGLTLSKIRYLKRAGVLSSENYKLMKKIYILYAPRRHFLGLRLNLRKQRFAAEWERVRENFKNDLPSIDIIREVAMIN